MKFKKQKFLKDILVYFVFAVTTSYISFLAIDFFGYQKQFIELWTNIYYPLWLVFPVSIVQEIFFRGWLMPVLRKHFKSALAVILLNAAIYASVHVIFPYSEFLLPGSFILGLAYAGLYYYRPNLLLIILCHVLFNVFVMPYCFFGCY